MKIDLQEEAKTSEIIKIGVYIYILIYFSSLNFLMYNSKSINNNNTVLWKYQI